MRAPAQAPVVGLRKGRKGLGGKGCRGVLIVGASLVFVVAGVGVGVSASDEVCIMSIWAALGLSNLGAVSSFSCSASAIRMSFASRLDRGMVTPVYFAE